MTRWMILAGPVAFVSSLAGGTMASASDRSSPDPATMDSRSTTVGSLAADDLSLSVSAGAIHSWGDFGAGSDTAIWAVPLSMRLAKGDWRLTASVPWMRIRSGGTIYSGIDNAPLVASARIATVKRVRRGIGDATIGAAYYVPLSTDGIGVELSGRAKLPTASDRSQLSTGKADFAGGIEVSGAAGKAAPFASVSYRVFGDNADWNFRDGIAASVGSSYRLSPRSTGVVSYSYARAATRQISDAHEVLAGYSTRLPGDRLRLTGYGTAGLSHGAPAASLGLSIGVTL